MVVALIFLAVGGPLPLMFWVLLACLGKTKKKMKKNLGNLLGPRRVARSHTGTRGPSKLPILWFVCVFGFCLGFLVFGGWAFGFVGCLGFPWEDKTPKRQSLGNLLGPRRVARSQPGTRGPSKFPRLWFCVSFGFVPWFCWFVVAWPLVFLVDLSPNPINL